MTFSLERIVYPKPLPWLAGGLLLLAIGIGIGLWYESYPELEVALFSENGPVEIPEMIALLLAIVAFITRAARSNDPISAICIPVAFLLAVAAIRETPRCDSSLYDGGMCFADQAWKTATTGLFAAAMAVGLFLRRGHFQAMFSLRVLFVFWPLWVSLTLLVCAEIGEKYGLLGTEETLELFAYSYLVAFCIWLFKKT